MRISEDDFDKVIEVNLKSVFNMTKAVIRPMMKQRSGSIINITFELELFNKLFIITLFDISILESITELLFIFIFLLKLTSFPPIFKLLFIIVVCKVLRDGLPIIKLLFTDTSLSTYTLFPTSKLEPKYVNFLNKFKSFNETSFNINKL